MPDNESNTPRRDLSLDALKGLAILMVLALHIGPVRFTVPGSWGVAGPGEGVVGAPLAAMLAVTYREILQLAVPVFLLISLALYVSRAATREGYARARIVRLAELLGFWLGVQFALAAVVTGGWPKLSWHMLRVGGPSLQSGGSAGTVLYFLVDLIALVAVAELALWVAASLGRRAGRAVAWALVALSVAWFLAAPLLGLRLEYWDLGNFLPYVGVALLLGGDLRRLVDARFALGIAAAALFAAEIAAVSAVPSLTMDTLPDYARPAIVVGALALVAFGLSYLPTPRALVLLGEYSLGVFALHALVQAGVNRLVPCWTLDCALGQLQINVLSGTLVVGFTLLAVAVLSRTPLRRFVR